MAADELAQFVLFHDRVASEFQNVVRINSPGTRIAMKRKADRMMIVATVPEVVKSKVPNTGLALQPLPGKPEGNGRDGNARITSPLQVGENLNGSR
jgi:hypothetical protein